MYKIIFIAEGDTLFSLFGCDWEKVYYSNLNASFRRKYRNPDRIGVDIGIKVPIDFRIPDHIMNNNIVCTISEESSASERLSNVKTFCCVTGNFRSGTTITNKILNFNPEVFISFEQNIVGKLHKMSLNDAFSEIIELSTIYKENGVFAGPKDAVIVGDKQPSNSATYSESNMRQLIANLGGIPIKFIHCIRDPFENILGRVVKLRAGGVSKTPSELIDWYFNNCDIIESAVSRHEFPRLLVYNEELIQNTPKVLQEICDFLDIPMRHDLAEYCAKKLFVTPRRHVKEHNKWTQHDVNDIKNRIKERDYLSRYL